MKKTILVFFLTLGSFYHSAIAQNNKPLRFLIEGALALGGDEVATVNFTNGQSQRVNAGQGISLGVGGEFTIPNLENFRLRSTVGIKYVTTAADNAHIRLTRIPINLSGNYVFKESWRLGLGMAFHTNIKFNAGGIGDNFTLGNAKGPLFELAYKWVGLSYTVMTYKDEFGDSYNANSIGLTFSGIFPKRN
jgi:hypothetical protein